MFKRSIVSVFTFTALFGLLISFQACKKSSSPTQPNDNTNPATPTFTSVCGASTCTPTITFTLTKTNTPTFTPITCLISSQVGNTLAGTSYLTGAGNLLASQIIVSGYSGIQSVEVYLNNASGQINAALYSDNSGPASLISSGISRTASNGWVTVSLSPSYVFSGTYWLVCQVQGSTQVAYSSGGSTNTLSFSWGAFPNAYPIGGTVVADSLSMYLNTCNANTPTFTPTFTPTITPTITNTPTITMTPTVTNTPVPPVITGVYVQHASGDATIHLKIYGTGFEYGATVNFWWYTNLGSMTTTYVNSTEIDFDMNLNVNCWPSATVTINNPDGGNSNTYTIQIQC